MIRLTASSLALGALLSATASLAETRQFHGYAYTLDGGDFRYIEQHRQELDGDTVTAWTVKYIGPDGEEIASKSLTPGAHPAIPEYTLEMASGYAESLSWDGDTVTITRTRDGDTREKRITPDEQACADSGFDYYVRQRWDAVVSGDKIKFDFILPGKLNDYGFKAKRIGAEDFEGREAHTIEVYLGGILGWFAPSLELAYDAETRRLREYRGIGNMHGDNGKPYEVRVSYYTEPPDGLPPAISEIVEAE